MNRRRSGMNLRKKWKKGYKAAIPVLAILAAGMMMNMPVQAAEISVGEAEIPAPETTVTSGSCGTNVTWSYDSEAKKLTISGTGKMKSPRKGGSSLSQAKAQW